MTEQPNKVLANQSYPTPENPCQYHDIFPMGPND